MQIYYLISAMSEGPVSVTGFSAVGPTGPKIRVSASPGAYPQALADDRLPDSSDWSC